jgi:hypothetical protein
MNHTQMDENSKVDLKHIALEAVDWIHRVPETR